MSVRERAGTNYDLDEEVSFESRNSSNGHNDKEFTHLKWESFGDVPFSTIHGLGTQPSFESYNSFAPPNSDESSYNSSISRGQESENPYVPDQDKDYPNLVSKASHAAASDTSNCIREINEEFSDPPGPTQIRPRSGMIKSLPHTRDSNDAYRPCCGNKRRSCLCMDIPPTPNRDAYDRNDAGMANILATDYPEASNQSKRSFENGEKQTKK